MFGDGPHIQRSLSARESQIVGWLEEERPALIRAEVLVDQFGLSRHVARDVLRRMATKGWLQRVSQGVYEPLLADTGGIALPNPWAALAGWSVPYYIGYGSAAYELGLTPDRPGAVQVCVRFGTQTPQRFKDFPLNLIPQRYFATTETEIRTIHSQSVRIATIPRLVIDGAIRPGRVSGVLGLTRIIDRAADSLDREKVVDLAESHPRGGPGTRRIAAILTLLERQVPKVLANYAHTHRTSSSMTLDSVSVYGWTGKSLPEWGVIANVPAEVLQEELRR